VSRLVPLVVAGPLLGAAITLLLGRWPTAQRAVTVTVLSGGLGLSVAAAAAVDRDGRPLLARAGGWDPSFGISYRVDRLSALMLVVAFATLLAVVVYAVGQRARDGATPHHHPAYLVLAAGVAAAFVTHDLFHLFVAFEVVLLSSYVLLTLDGRGAQVRAGTTYVVINCVESTVLLAAVGMVYAATGTLDMGSLPAALAELDPGLRTGLHLLLLVAFGLKAAVFPLFFWLPDAYPTAASPVTAVFAGLLTKVGVYCLVRTQTLLFPDEHRTMLLWIAGLTMIVGVLGAIAQNDIKRILSFHIVSQIGYMVMGLAIGGTAAVAATVFFLLHQIPIKTSLFLVEGIVERVEGTGALDRIGGLARRSGLLAALFALPALSLAGVPPFSGFVGKLGLVTAGIEQRSYTVVATALVGSLLTLVSMTKIWIGAFWGDPGRDGPAATAPVPVARRHPLMTASTGALVAAGLVLAVAAGPLYRYCERTAAEMTAPADSTGTDAEAAGP